MRQVRKGANGLIARLGKAIAKMLNESKVTRTAQEAASDNAVAVRPPRRGAAAGANLARPYARPNRPAPQSLMIEPSMDMSSDPVYILDENGNLVPQRIRRVRPSRTANPRRTGEPVAYVDEAPYYQDPMYDPSRIGEEYNWADAYNLEAANSALQQDLFNEGLDGGFDW